MDKDSTEFLIRKVTQYVSFGQPVASGSIISQRLSDPRIPIQAFYLTMQMIDQEQHYYHEVWLKKDGDFAVLEAWYRETNVTRKLLKERMNFAQLKEEKGPDFASQITMRITEILKKSDRDGWRKSTRRPDFR